MQYPETKHFSLEVFHRSVHREDPPITAYPEAHTFIEISIIDNENRT